MASSFSPPCSGFARLVFFLFLVTAGAYPSSAVHPRKLLQSSPAMQPVATPAPAPASQNASTESALGRPVPQLGGSPPLYQPPGILTNPACATDDTVVQLTFTLIGDVLGLIPEVGTILQDMVSFLQGQTQQGVWDQVKCRVEALIAQAIDKQAWGIAHTTLTDTITAVANYLKAPTTFEDFDSFVRGTFTSSARATMEGAYQNYGQQFVLLPMYTQFANLHIGLLRNALWGPLGKTLGMSSENNSTVAGLLAEAIANYHGHVADVQANYVTPAGANNCWTWTRKNANHRLFHFSVARAGYMYWQNADVWNPPTLIDKTEIYSDPTGYTPSFELFDYYPSTKQIFVSTNRSFCENWGNPVIPWPPVTAYHAANPDDTIVQMQVVAGYRIDKWGVKYRNAPTWEPMQGEQGGHQESGVVNNDVFNVPPLPGDERQDPIVKVEIVRAPELRDFDGWHFDGAYGLRLHFADGGVRPFPTDGRQNEGWWGNHPVDSDQSQQVEFASDMGYNTVLSLSYPGYILSSVLAPGPDTSDSGHNYQGAMSFIFGWRRSDSYPNP